MAEDSTAKADAVIEGIEAAENEDLRPLGMSVPSWWATWQRYAEAQGSFRVQSDSYTIAQAAYERGWLDRGRIDAADARKVTRGRS